MITTQAACCLISDKPGVANGTTLTGRFSEPVKCARCQAAYRLEYAGGEVERVANYESKLRSVAQRLINADHPPDITGFIHHTTIINVMGLD